jgi:hypothetical protein
VCSVYDRLQLCATLDVAAVIPDGGIVGKGVHLEARDDAEFVLGPFHIPDIVAVAPSVNAHGESISQP